jgi:hypothetical protein
MVDVQTSEVNAKLESLNVGVLYSDRSSEDERLLIRPFLRETKNKNMAGG